MTAEYLPFNLVIEIHTAVMAAEGQAAHLVRPDDLAAAVERPMATAFGEDLYPSLSAKAAALMHSIITRHPFLDGNKRTGLTAAIVFLAVNGVTARADQDALYDLTLAVASGALRDLDEIARQLALLFGIEDQ